MRLTSVYRAPLKFGAILYDLLKERQPHVSISHKKLPTWRRHLAFIRSKPYAAWYMIDVGEEQEMIVGAIYLSKFSEIGVFIFEAHRGRGYGSEAMRLLMQKHPRKRYLANINPANGSSIQFFEDNGFKHLSNTYELCP